MIEYPTEDELDLIKGWEVVTGSDFLGLMDFVGARWSYPDRFCKGKRRNNEGKTVYHLSTGGWSGNESLIGAMQDNTLFWMFCWWSSTRGGHYVFKVPPLTSGP